MGWEGGSDYRYDNDERIDEISRKLYGLREFSLVSLEELSSKLDTILDKLGNSVKKEK